MNILAGLAVLFMVCAIIQVAEPAAAAIPDKAFKVDQGTKYFYSGQSGPMKMSWKTYLYLPSNKRKIFQTFYVKDNGRYSGHWVVSWHEIITLQKVTKTKMKITDYTDNELHPGTTVTYKKTKLSTRKYYWYVYRPAMLRNLG
jgi:hypothetical protein